MNASSPIAMRTCRLPRSSDQLEGGDVLSVNTFERFQRLYRHHLLHHYRRHRAFAGNNRQRLRSRHRSHPLRQHVGKCSVSGPHVRDHGQRQPGKLNTVTATVAVVAVNDAPVAGADSIITNAGTGETFIVPEWALLANDRDVDSSTLDVTATTSNSSMTTSLLPNPGSVTVTDGVPSGGNFNYTVSDGSTTGTGSVSVTQDTTGSLDGTGNADILIAAPVVAPRITHAAFATPAMTLVTRYRSPSTARPTTYGRRRWRAAEQVY